MAPTPIPGADDPYAVAPLKRGDLGRYPVSQPDGTVSHQVVLITTDADDNGTVRGFPLGYEHQAGQFRPDDFTPAEPTPRPAE